MSKGTINKCQFIGRLGEKPELRYMPDGTGVLNFDIATTETYRHKDTGRLNDLTDWHRLVAYGNIAKNIVEYCDKGSKLFIEARHITRKWQDNNGDDRYTSEFKVREMQFMDKRKVVQDESSSSYQSERA